MGVFVILALGGIEVKEGNIDIFVNKSNSLSWEY